MGRFLFWFFLFVFISGILLHYKVEFPYFISWIGNLPGDMTVTKGKVIFYLPIATSAVFSLALTILFSLFAKKKV